MNALPVGPPVPPHDTPPPRRAPLEGSFVHLRPVKPGQDADRLYVISHGNVEVEALWTYLPYGPFEDVVAMRKWLEGLAGLSDPLFFTVLRQEDHQPAGMTSFLNIIPAHRRLEIGHIWFGPAFQRTKANTEMAYLMLRESFESLGYRRVEWKCDALNARSRAAAERLGFRYEGLFRQHVVYKDRSRDTTWYAMMDHEWPGIRKNMENWLYSSTPGPSLREMNRTS